MAFIRDLSQVTAVRPLGDGRFALDVAEGWLQGRGTFGGLVLGAFTRAFEQVVGDPGWPLRSLMGQLPAPVPAGPAEIQVEVMRRGSGTCTLSGRLVQAGALLASATAVFGKQRVDDREWVDLPAPTLLAPEAAPVVPVGPPFAPDFARFLEFRAVGHLPFSGDREPVTEGWIRPFEASGGLGAPELVALADAWWPATFSREEGPRPVSTVAFTFELCADLAGLSPDEPLYHRARAVSSHGGFWVELRELWDRRGRLLALNQQTFAFIR